MNFVDLRPIHLQPASSPQRERARDLASSTTAAGGSSTRASSTAATISSHRTLELLLPNGGLQRTGVLSLALVPHESHPAFSRP